ncbi:hypothetical protein Acr_26g0014070 [Actinidia rufa]|uniref:Uncharacterized protein n=1 Tax=Actinidia rufa TaxID=165716 RepID=A0A7J0H546_9ERIC|nr:hypothetical protein Acr_26g0014070 [Actinidia rufa]
MHFQTEVLTSSHLGALLPPPGCAAKYVALQVVVTPSLLPCVHNWRDHHHLSRETHFGDVAPVAVHRLCLSPLSFSLWTSYTGCTFSYLDRLPHVSQSISLRSYTTPDPSIPLGLCRTTAPLVWRHPSSRYTPSVFLLLQHFLFSLKTLSVPPLASKLHRFESCISMKHALSWSPSWISRLPCGTKLFLCQQLFIVLFAIRTSPSHATCVENTSLSPHKWQAILESKIQSDSSSVNTARRTSLSSTAIIAVVAASED